VGTKTDPDTQQEVEKEVVCFRGGIPLNYIEQITGELGWALRERRPSIFEEGLDGDSCIHLIPAVGCRGLDLESARTNLLRNRLITPLGIRHLLEYFLRDCRIPPSLKTEDVLSGSRHILFPRDVLSNSSLGEEGVSFMYLNGRGRWSAKYYKMHEVLTDRQFFAVARRPLSATSFFGSAK